MIKDLPSIMKTGILVSAAAAIGTFGLGGVANASHMAASDKVYTYEAQLDQLNNSGTSGRAHVVAQGSKAYVMIKTTGSSAGLPHAQHLHLGPADDSASTCPVPSDDANGDGVVDVRDAASNYGPIGVSLTTSGDTSPSSALAVDRYPVGASDGSFTYERMVDLPAGVTAANLGNTEIVQHGISKLYDNPTMYDGAARSSIAPSLPLEATVPADCGGLRMTSSFAPMTNNLERNVESLDMQLMSDAMGVDSKVNGSEAAVVNYTNSLETAKMQYASTVKNAVSGATSRDMYINTLNTAKATYLNEIEMARNQLVSQLSNMGHDANVAKDMLVNSYNQHRDMFANQAEVIKNSI